MTKVVCFGDSHTRGLICPSYVAMLEERLSVRGFVFVNAGVNNDHTLNLLRRANKVIAERPDVIIVMIGSNDIISMLSWRIALFNRVRKLLPRRPSLHLAAINVSKLLRRLQAESGAHVAIASIPPLGEDLDSAPVRRVREYNRLVKRIAGREGVTYLPIFECMETYLREHGHQPGRAYHGSIRLLLELVRARITEGVKFDEFSARKGFTLLTDGVHFNRTGARLIADVFEAYLTEGETGI